MSHTMLQHHATPMSLEPTHMRNMGGISKNVCGNEDLMIAKSYGKSDQMLGHCIQQVRSEFMIRLREKVSIL